MWKIVSIYLSHAVNQVVTCSINFVHVKHTFYLFIKAFFIFNINLSLVNESRVKIKSLRQKYFANEIIK